METDKKTQVRYSLAVFLFIFTVMTVGIAVVGYLSYRNYERQFHAQAESQIASIAELKVDELQDWRNERIADAEVLHQNLAFSEQVQRYLENPADAQARAVLQSWLDEYQAYDQYDRVFMLDVGGVERISSPTTPEPVATHLTQEIAAVLSAGQVTFVDFHRDTADGPICLSLLVPIYTEQDSRPLGLVVLRIDPNVYLYPYLQQWPVPSASAETALVRREGDYALHLSKLRFQENAALNLRVPLENTQRPAVKAVLGQEGIVEGVNYRGVPVIAYAHAVPDSPWFLLARVDAVEVYAPLRARLWQTAVFFGTLVATAGAALGLMWWQQRARYYRGQAKAGQALRASEERFRIAAQNASDLIWEWDIVNGKLDWFGAIDELLGYTPGEFPRTIEAWEGIIHPDDHDRVMASLDRHLEARTPYVEEYRIRRKDGTLGYWTDKGEAVWDDGDNARKMIGVCTDITERKRQEAEILAARGELQQLLAQSDQSRRALLSVVEDQKRAEEALALQARIATLFLTISDDEMFTEVLRVVLDAMHSPFGVFGYLDGAGALVVPTMTRQVWDMCQVPDKTIRFPRETWGDSSWPRTIREKKANYSNEVSTRAPEGHVTITRHISWPILFQGEVIGLFQVANKETAYTEADRQTLETIADHVAPLLSARLQREQAQEELRKLNAELKQRVRDRTSQLQAANKELEAFAYSVSHDLRAPLRAMDGFSAALLSQYSEHLDEQGRHYLDRIQEASRRMGQLIDDLLTLSRVTRAALIRQQIDLSALAREIATDLQAQSPQRQVEFVIAERLVAKADPRLLRVALQNLLDNAWKFTGKREQAHIEIGSELGEGSEPIYYIKDNGVGFDMVYAGKLFAPFQRLHGMHEFPGTGIGLATVQRIVARHGGRVWTEAAADQGATFYFTLGGM